MRILTRSLSCTPLTPLASLRADMYHNFQYPHTHLLSYPCQGPRIQVHEGGQTRLARAKYQSWRPTSVAELRFPPWPTPREHARQEGRTTIPRTFRLSGRPFLCTAFESRAFLCTTPSSRRLSPPCRTSQNAPASQESSEEAGSSDTFSPGPAHDGPSLARGGSACARVRGASL